MACIIAHTAKLLCGKLRPGLAKLGLSRVLHLEYRFFVISFHENSINDLLHHCEQWSGATAVALPMRVMLLHKRGQLQCHGAAQHGSCVLATASHQSREQRASDTALRASVGLGPRRLIHRSTLKPPCVATHHIENLE